MAGNLGGVLMEIESYVENREEMMIDAGLRKIKMDYERSMMAIKTKVRKVEWRNKILKNRNRTLKKRLEEEKTCKICVEARERGDLLVKKCEIHELHIDMLERKYLEKATLLHESLQEIARLNSLVTQYETQMTSYAERSGIEGDVGRCFEFKMVVPQTPQGTPRDNSVRASIQIPPNPPNENEDVGAYNIVIKKELTDELDNATLWCRKVAIENLKRLDPNYQNVQNGNTNWECEQDDRWSVFNEDEEATGSEDEQEQNGEHDDEDDDNEIELSDGSQVCKWIREDGKRCGAVSKSGEELTEHFVEEHFGSPGPTGYVCHWQGCKRNKAPMKFFWGNLMAHLQTHLCTHSCTHEGCKKVFSDRKAAARHQRRGHRAEMVKCTYPECTKVFKSMCFLKKHLRVHEQCVKPSSDGVFTCEFPGCGRAFKYIKPFQKHVASHPPDDKLCTEDN